MDTNAPRAPHSVPNVTIAAALVIEEPVWLVEDSTGLDEEFLAIGTEAEVRERLATWLAGRPDTYTLRRVRVER